MNRDKLNNLRIRELEIFEVVARAKSVREAARRLGMTPGEVSKSVRGLEKKLGLQLLQRSATGVVLSEKGAQGATHVQEILALVDQIQGLTRTGSASATRRTSIASTSFLITHLLAPQLRQTRSPSEAGCFRFIDVAPDQMMNAGLRGAFEAAFHFGNLSWPRTWISQSLGPLEWILCARKAHPLPARPSMAQILEYPFVLPTYWTSEGFQYGSDHFPVPISKRKRGDETSTADAALPIILASDQLAFLPGPLVEKALADKELRRVSCPEIKDIHKELFLSVRTDAVSASLFESWVAHFTKVLGKSR